MKINRIMRNIKTIALIISAFIAVNLQGQLVNSMYYMDNLPQASKLNPARMPNCNFYINLPNVSTKIMTGLGPQHFLTNDNVVKDTLRMPYYNEDLWDDFMDKLDDPISLMLETEIGFGMGWRKNRGYYHFDISQRNMVGINLAKDMLTLNNLGQGVIKDFSTMSMNASAFLQFGMGYAREINSDLSVGGKIKLLKGLMNANMVVNKSDLYTSRQKWSFDADADVNLSFPVKFILDDEGQIEELDDSRLEEIGDDPVAYAKEFASPMTNLGLAVDLGVEYKLLPKLHLSASVIDLGKIWWNNDVSNIKAETKEKMEFDGISDEPIFYDNDEFDQYITDLGDSLVNLLSYAVSGNNYSTGLAPKLYFGAEYFLTDAISLGVLSNTTFYRKQIMQSVMFSANANFYHFLTAGAHYGWNWGYANTAGATLGFNLFPLQIYIAADYLPIKYQKVLTGDEIDLGFRKQDYVPVPINFNALSFQIGMNLKFGCKKRYNIPIYDNEFDESIPGLRNL